VHLVGFIIKKFMTLHGHMNVKFTELLDDGLVRPKYVRVRLLIFDCGLRRLCT
jgi:hypothetical protein